MSRTCDACGRDAVAATSIGGTILCRICAPMVQAEIELLRSAGKMVSAPRIAASMRRDSGTDYLLRAVPPDLWERVKAAAARKNQSARDWILGAMDDKLGIY